MSGITKIILIFLLLLIAAAPLAVFAADSLVPCGRKADSNLTDDIDETAPCTLCHLFVLAQRILNFIMWQIAPVLAVLVIAWGGFKMLTAGANPGRRQEGIKSIQTAVIGLLIVFTAWVIVNEVLLFFAPAVKEGGLKGLQSPWNQISCVPKNP